MARGVRLNPKHDERTRAKIQTSQIINRLEAFIKSECEMTAPQVTAALGLLKKSLPDLAAVQHTGSDDGPIEMKITWTGTKSADS